ncbi:MAG: glucodextranase DOMON-like domain-containing protein [Candidatus Thalassarchaeaceae archaeon]|jgi:alpha-amylase/alpha-mannosidase (GH57 family)|nr:glucodextranase DOMON-like domain-containing protein [Candidatus Thalassarchaeaceae archaeon]
MMRKALFLCCIFLIQTGFIFVSATTPETITIDGSLSEWSSESNMATDSNNVTLSMTWDTQNLYLAWEGTDWKSSSEGADLFVYINTSEGGSVLSKDWNFAHTLPFAADHGFVMENDSYFRHIEYDGTAWAEQSTTVEVYAGWENNKVTEISLPWSALGSPTSFEIMAYSQWQDDGHVWTSFPIQNPASSNGAETFTHAWHVENVNDSVNPSTLPVVETGGVEKVSDALNLAIVFHQHQPYYKNKLTNTYEMPWVRVHSMAEYVDSPGILADTDTKVTYNLVPSFVEQLVDYHNNETLDVHTDIAKRSWSQGGYPNATALELHTMQFQSFWNSGWIYNVSETGDRQSWLYPSSARYSQLYDMTLHNLKPNTIMDDDLLAPQDFLDLQVLWYLYQFSPDYVQGMYNSSHHNQGLIDLFMQNGNYTHIDLMYVINTQHQDMGNVLPMYSELAASGQVELTTTPYYHPIMPLLMMDGWTMEDGIHVNKEAWPEDVQNHLINGMNLFEEELGFRPVGMWPSEQAVSPAMVEPVTDVGIEWMVSDEELLKQSTDSNGASIDVDDASNLATPWIATGAEGGEVAVIFRDRVISDRIAFQYGSMTPEAAVSDFISYIDNIRQELLDDSKDPSEHLLTVALDGENWMFMSEFQHADNARPFMEEWYGRLATHPTIVTTTPSEFLDKNTTLPHIQTIGTGSWIDGTLRTWAGEAEESLAWQRLVEAREALVDFDSENPNHAGLEAAWESLYIAEGSDWYWWYGLDQDSGYDENWDVLFKVHLSNIYRAINLELPPYLQELWTGPATPTSPYDGIIEPMIDGIALPGEWDGAAMYDAGSNDNLLDIESFHLGYDASSVYIRIDIGSTPTDWEVMDLAAAPDVSIYFMQPNAINFNEVQTNFRTYYGNQILGFPAKNMVSFNFDQLREDGKAKYDLFTAQGKVGDTERWNLAGQSILGGCAVDDVFEFQIPWSDLGLAPRYSTRVKVVTSWVNSTTYGDGIDEEIAPPAPAEMIMPDLEEWVTLLDFDDPLGDENGDGTYVYPLASDFAPGSGLFDVTNLKISQSSWNARFELTFAEMTDYWGLRNGFSHQIVQIYVDQGDNLWGETDTLEGANVVIHDDWAWEVAISATGEPGAVKSVNAQTGETSAKGIEVSGDIATKTVSITVSKTVIGYDVPNYRFVIIAGSQDGFGPGKWREVDAEAKTWRLGGGDDPNPSDGIDYDPNVLDIVMEGSGQAAMLGAYDVANQEYAVITGIELPEVAQQVYGAKVVSTTATTAILEWSTTRESGSNVTCGTLTFEETGQGLSHTLQLTGLESNASYNCSILIEGIDAVSLSFNTSAVIDNTPPDLLNLAVEVIEGGSLRVTWYTSEEATESIEVAGQSFAGDEVALRKNHDMTIVPYPELTALETYTLTVTISDASGNTNSSSVDFVIEEEDAASPLPDEGTPGDDTSNSDSSNDDSSDTKSISDLLSDPVAQIALLVVIIAILLALIRTRKNEFDDDEKWT